MITQCFKHFFIKICEQPVLINILKHIKMNWVICFHDTNYIIYFKTSSSLALLQSDINCCGRQFCSLVCLRGPWQWDQDLSLVCALVLLEPIPYSGTSCSAFMQGRGSWTCLIWMYQALLTPHGRPYKTGILSLK